MMPQRMDVFPSRFAFKDFDGATGMFVPVTDEAKLRTTFQGLPKEIPEA
jgi:hypothetical protein